MIQIELAGSTIEAIAAENNCELQKNEIGNGNMMYDLYVGEMTVVVQLCNDYIGYSIFKTDDFVEFTTMNDKLFYSVKALESELLSAIQKFGNQK